MNTNVCVFTGRVVANAETKKINEGFSITSFAIAVNEKVKDSSKESGYGDRANFINMAIFGNYGDRLRPALTKGREITATCRFHQDRWTKDGRNYERAVFYVDNVVIQREPKAKTESNIPQDVARLADAFGGEVMPQDAVSDGSMNQTQEPFDVF